MNQAVLAPCERDDGFPPPRDFQIKAHDALRTAFKSGHKNQIIMAPTGAGKTYLGLRVCREAVLKGRRAVFLCDRTTLINQTSEVADRYGMHEHGIIQADHWRRRPDELFQIASIQTIAKRQFWPKVDVLVVDECFPGDTLISTTNGLVEIRNIRSGDLIYNSIGTGRVNSVFCKPATNFVKVRTSDGTTFRCTPDHPVFTGMGWKPAGTLGIGEKLFRIQGVQGLWGENVPEDGKISERHTASASGISVQESHDLREILREEIEEPYAQRIIEEEDAGHIDQDRAQTKIKINEGRISASLQVGFGECSVDGGDRTGRDESLRHQEARARSQEGCFAAIAWVESVEIEERGSPELVYNLRVSGHPSYFANGILVHNCHTTYKSWTDFAENTGAVVIGLSATPFAPGLGKIFTNLVNATTMFELTQLGVLVPLRIFSCRRPDMTGAEKKGGEWTDKAAEEREMGIVGDVVSDWMKHGENRKTIVFGATIKHCEELCRQFINAGVMAAVFTSETTDKERKKLLEEYRKPGSYLRVLISVEALAKGFDVPDVGCVCDARPLCKSLSTAIQMWGRGLRSSPETGKQDCYLLDFSGNIVRFFDDFNDIYFNGLDKLDDGAALDKKTRTKEEFEPKGCPRCGHKPFSKRCMACGYENVSPEISEAKPGHMQEIFIGHGANKKKLADNAEHLWNQICTYARIHSKPETQSGRAWHLFRQMTGQETQWRFSTAPVVEITRPVINKIRSMNIAFQKKAAKK